MFKKILIANRGEIACRIMETAHRLGIATVAVYADPDREARHVAIAGEAVRIGTGPATQSYLLIDAIVGAAKATGAEAIHPGYGFLAENPDLARACKASGIAFIGPSADAMEKLGGKAEAKRIAEAAGVPVVPGYQGDAQDAELLAREAEAVGYPVMIKAVAGGGGRGMRLVERAADFADALDSATREAQSAFGDARVLIEKFVVKPRHIEVQVFGDSHGNAVHMFERDCTLQRRNQKVLEEAPAPGMSPELREKMTSAAVALAKSVGYEGAGTVEFLVEGGALTAEAPWYFIEMNTRLQVEHPVTEEITGLDLVEWQLRIAAGEKLPLAQDRIEMSGHAVEARVCAEDPARDFAPSIGRIHLFSTGFGPDLRVETGVTDGSEISPFYDSLIAKLICTGRDREEALSALAQALEETHVAGLQTNTAFLHALVVDQDVAAARMTTGLIAEKMDELAGAGKADPRAVGAGVMALLAADSERSGAQGDGHLAIDPWTARDGFQLGASERRMVRPLLVDGELRDVAILWRSGRAEMPTIVMGTQDGDEFVFDATEQEAFENDAGGIALAINDRTAFAIHRMQHTRVSWPEYDAEHQGGDDDPNAIIAPINGRVARISVSEGQKVEENQPVAIVEAMKMEHVLTSPRAGVVESVAHAEGDQVSEGMVIVALAAEDGE